MTSPPPRPAVPLVVAHRGSSARQPENTFAAFDAALDDGADGLELDVQLTADGRPVVFHDADLRRILQQPRRIDRVPFSLLGSQDVAAHFAPGLAPARVPALSEILDRYLGRTYLFVELKRQRTRAASNALLDRVLDMLPGPGRVERLWLIGFSLRLMHRAKARRPDVPVAWTHGSPLGAHDRLSAAAATGLDGLLQPARHARARTAERLHRNGRWLLTYACDDPDGVRTALSAGADVLMADDPVLLRRRVEGWLPRSSKAHAGP
ncbi:MAG: glycerophosphodiester phosphodiesterase [Deltaproteobacteria bacterium]|nr:MAG: glycerophosphodiester phosphodiesterase [Deltaproteobacteria bacterium]